MAKHSLLQKFTVESSLTLQVKDCVSVAENVIFRKETSV